MDHFTIVRILVSALAHLTFIGCLLAIIIIGIDRLLGIILTISYAILVGESLKSHDLRYLRQITDTAKFTEYV